METNNRIILITLVAMGLILTLFLLTSITARENVSYCNSYDKCISLNELSTKTFCLYTPEYLNPKTDIVVPNTQDINKPLVLHYTLRGSCLVKT